MNITHKTLAIIAAGIVACCAAPAFANPSGDGGNGGINVDDATIPSQSAVSYTVVLQGNQLSNLGVPPSDGDSGQVNIPYWADPFCASPNSCPVSVSFDPTTQDTTIVYSGTQGLLGSPIDGSFYHFGWIDGYCTGNCSELSGIITDSYWTFGNVSKKENVRVASASVSCLCKLNSKNTQVAVVYYQAEFKSGLAARSWNIVLYTPTGSRQPKVVFKNHESQAMEVTNTGIVLGIKAPTDYNGWQTLVSMMNFQNMPPPGMSGSPFEPLANPPPKILKPVKVKATTRLQVLHMLGKR